MSETQGVIRVVLADDHAVVRAGIRQFLEQAADIEVVAEADHGEAAKAMVKRYLPDVAVLDIQMPESSGIEVTRWIRKNQPEVGVLILSAYDDDPYVIAVLQAGANGYVLKTASPKEIIQAVRDVYAGNTALDASVLQKLVTQVASGARPMPIERLSDRETEVLSAVAQGLTNKAIAVQLGISDRTVQGHLAHIFNKLQASSRTEAVMRAVSLGWLPTNLGQLND